MANTQLKLRQLIQDGAATDNVIKWDGAKWVAGAVPSLDGNQVFIEGFAGSVVDLDANDGTVKNAAGTNVAFTLPSNLDSFFVYKNGIRLDRDGVGTRDYSLNTTTNTITFTVALTAADIVTLWKGTINTGGGGGALGDGDKGDIIVSGSGTVWSIDTDVVTYAKIQNVANNNRILGRISGAGGDIEELTGTQVTTLIDTFSTSTTTKGLVPGSNAVGATYYLNGNGAWSIPAGGGATNLTYTAATRVIASDTGTDATLPLFTSTDAGLVPLSGGGTANFLRADGTWAAPAGGGDVVGPASAVNNRVVFFDGITGKLIKDSGLTLSGSNTGDQTTIVGITGTKAQFDTAVTDGNFMYVGDVPTAHTLDSHSNVTITANSSGEILKWNGSAWINNTLAEAGIQPAGSYLTGNQTITLSGDVTGSGATAITTTIAAGAVDIAMLSATGTPSASTYLRGDNTWATVSGSGDIVNGGQAGPITIGTNDVSSLSLETNGASWFVMGTEGNLTLAGETAKTSTVEDRILLRTNSTGTTAAGFGGQIKFQLEDASGNLSQDAASISSTWKTATTGTAKRGYLNFGVTGSGGTLGDVVRISADTVPTVEISSTPGNFASAMQLTTSSITTTAANSITFMTGSSSGGASAPLITVGRSVTQTSGTASFGHLSLSAGLTNSGGTGPSYSLLINPTLTTITDFRGVDIPVSDANAKGIYQSGSLTTNRFVGATTFGSTNAPDSSALIDMVSTTKGLGLPAMDTTAVNAISTPRDGLVVYDTTTDTLKVRANGAWTSLGSGGATNLSYDSTTRVISSDTGTDATLPLFSSTDAGLVPLSGGGTTNFLRADGTWAAPTGVTNLSLTGGGGSPVVIHSDTGTDVTVAAGTGITLSQATGTMTITATATGDVTGQASSIDSEIALFSSTTGKVIKRATGTGIVNVTSGVYQTPITAPAGSLVGTTATQTLTNKRIDPRVSTVASSATPTPNADTDDVYTITALAAGATFGAPTGTPVQGQKLIIRVKDNGTGRSLLYNAIYRAMGVALPTVTVASKTLYFGMIYNATDTKWDIVAVSQEA